MTPSSSLPLSSVTLLPSGGRQSGEEFERWGREQGKQNFKRQGSKKKKERTKRAVEPNPKWKGDCRPKLSAFVATISVGKNASSTVAERK